MGIQILFNAHQCINIKGYVQRQFFKYTTYDNFIFFVIDVDSQGFSNWVFFSEIFSRQLTAQKNGVLIFEVFVRSFAKPSLNMLKNEESAKRIFSLNAFSP